MGSARTQDELPTRSRPPGQHAVVHIGATKSGSTAVQDCLNANRKLLRSQHRIHYCLAGLRGLTGHHALATLLAQEPTHSIASRLGDELGRIDEDSTPVLSTEYLSVPAIARVVVPVLSRVLTAAGFSMEVVVVIRHPVHWLESLYAQRIKSGEETRPVDEWFADGQASDWSADRLTGALRPWLGLDVPVRVTALPYVRDSAPDGDATEQFLRTVLNIPHAPQAAEWRIPSKNANPSLPVAALEVVRQAVQCAPGTPAAMHHPGALHQGVQAIAAGLDEMAPSYRLLDDERRSAMTATFREEWAKLSEFGPLGRLTEPERLRDRDLPPLPAEVTSGQATVAPELTAVALGLSLHAAGEATLRARRLRTRLDELQKSR